MGRGVQKHRGKMKKLIFLIFLILLFVAPAFGAPFLVSDPSPDGATSYQVEIDGVATEAFQGNTVHYDLVNMTIGQHTIRAKFISVWGESEWSAPFPLTRPGPSSAPGNLKLVP